MSTYCSPKYQVSLSPIVLHTSSNRSFPVALCWNLMKEFYTCNDNYLLLKLDTTKNNCTNFQNISWVINLKPFYHHTKIIRHCSKKLVNSFMGNKNHLKKICAYILNISRTKNCDVRMSRCQNWLQSVNCVFTCVTLWSAKDHHKSSTQVMWTWSNSNIPCLECLLPISPRFLCRLTALIILL